MSETVYLVVVLYHPNSAQKIQWTKVGRDFPTIFVDNSEDNIGYAAGANTGSRKAYDQGAQWVLLLNQDVVLTTPALKELMNKAKGSAPSIIGSFAGELDRKRWTTIYPGKTVDYISGSCMLFHKEIFEMLNGFYEPYFMYYEDVDFCVRAKQQEFAIRQVSAPGIVHSDRKNFGKSLKQQNYFLARNHFLFVLRLAPWWVKVYELIRFPKTLYEYWH